VLEKSRAVRKGLRTPALPSGSTIMSATHLKGLLDAPLQVFHHHDDRLAPQRTLSLGFFSRLLLARRPLKKLEELRVF